MMNDDDAKTFIICMIHEILLLMLLDFCRCAGEEAKTKGGREEKGVRSSEGQRRAGFKKTTERRTPGKIP